MFIFSESATEISKEDENTTYLQIQNCVPGSISYQDRGTRTMEGRSAPAAFLRLRKAITVHFPPLDWTP
jgi:hypothetical protein